MILAFVAMIGVTTTYAVLNGKEEQEARAEEVDTANEEAEAVEEEPVGEEKSADEGKAKTGAAAGGKEKTPISGPGGTLQLAASPTDIAYDKTELSSEPGDVTIDFTNPSALEHDVAIEQDGKEVAGSDLIAEGKTSVTRRPRRRHLHLPLHRAGASRSRHGRHPDGEIDGASRRPRSLACGARHAPCVHQSAWLSHRQYPDS